MKINVLDYLRLRVLSYYQEALLLKQGEMPAPRMCILYPTYCCNHRCVGCDYAELNNGGRSLSREEFDRVLDELLSIGIRSVEFCGGGEPTLHAYLPKAIDRLVANGIAFGLLTNGTNLTDEIMEKLAEHGSYCRISMEASSREMFDRYKNPRNGKAGFAVVKGNIEGIVAVRNALLPGSRLQISLKYSVDMNNRGDAVKAVELARSLGVDSVQFKCIRNVPSEITDEGIIQELKDGLEEEKLKYPAFRVLVNLEKSRLEKCRCWLSPLQLTVDPFGDVYICCYYRHRMESHRLGNIIRQDLRSVWYSREHWLKISEIDPKECNQYDCRFHYYNELMHELVIQDNGQLCFI